MKDCRGKEIKIGDIILHISGTRVPRYGIGIVTRLTQHTLEYRETRGWKHTSKSFARTFCLGKHGDEAIKTEDLLKFEEMRQGMGL